MTNGEFIIDHFKRCCKMAKKFSGSDLPLMRVQHLAAVRYGFKSFAELKSKPFDLIMQFDTRLDVPIITEVILNA
jgi:hypothetical protein